MTKALLIIDYTWDFVADEGKLTAGVAAQAIETELFRLVQEAYTGGDSLFFAVDGHDPADVFHPENKLFPPHNLLGTKGRNLYGRLGQFYEEVQASQQVLWLDKRHYSAFSGTDLDIRLRERRVDTVVLTGVLTDICVLHTAIDAYNLGYAIEVHSQATASVTPERHAFALNHMEKVLGARVIF